MFLGAMLFRTDLKTGAVVVDGSGRRDIGGLDLFGAQGSGEETYSSLLGPNIAMLSMMRRTIHMTAAGIH